MEGLILALNAGSSTLKCAVFEAGDEGPTAVARTLLETGGRGETVIGDVLGWCGRMAGGRSIDAVGHRVVHGGTAFQAPVRIDEAVMTALEALCPLAPLHQPQSLALIRAAVARLPGAIQVACFDTSFHSGQAPVATRFGLPAEMHARGVRRYGFHGLSYEYVTGQLARLDPALAAGRVIVAHLGSGASLCAVRAGRSVDTTMGFSPLDGLVMSSRPGSLDPGVVLYLQEHDGLSAAEVQDLLYHRSGLLGVSGVSGDMRDLLASTEPGARDAIDLFVYRLAREAGALASSLGGLDGVVFTAGIGEHSPEIRTRVAERLAWLGLDLDEAANHGDGARRISRDGSSAKAWVIPTDEERMIAGHTRESGQTPR